MKKMIADKVLKNIRCKSSKVVATSARENQVSELLEVFENFSEFPDRQNLSKSDFLMSIDHCFQVKGSGTIFTGTVLSGSVKIGDSVEIVHLKEEKKIKSIQKFREKCDLATCGDRAAICVTQFDAKKVERGLLASPKSVKSYDSIIVKINKVKLFKEGIESNHKFHLTCGHQLATSKITLFRPRNNTSEIDLDSENYLSETIFDYVPRLEDTETSSLALLEFDRPMYFLPSGLLIGSRLELDSNTVKNCRIAFSANIQKTSFFAKNLLKVLKDKSKAGSVERLHDANTLIIKNMFKKETNFDLFNRLKVSLSTGEDAVIDGTFGTTGKIKIYNQNGFSEETQNRCRKPKKGEIVEKQDPITVQLNFCKNIFSNDKNDLIQL